MRCARHESRRSSRSRSGCRPNGRLAPAWALALAATPLAACGDAGPERASEPGGFELGEVELVLPRAGMPNLHAAADGRILLTWLEETAPERWALRLAERRGGAWGEPRTVAADRDFFVNWADFPSAVALGEDAPRQGASRQDAPRQGASREGAPAEDALAVHWLERVADAPYAYHVMLSTSADGGERWSEPLVPHRDASPTEHGFVSMAPWREGAALVWLDGRAMAPDAHGALSETGAPHGEAAGAGGAVGGDGAMSLRATTLAPGGALGAEALLDARTCECCQTGMARTAEGLLVAYRDRSAEEVRDIAVVRFDGEAWSEPRRVHEDGWEIPGCPVNGPQVSAEAERAVVAWFTGAGGAPRALAAFSEDAGASWGEPVRVDDGRPIGRVDVALLPDGSAAVAWIEARADGAALLLRRVTAAGGVGPAAVVSETAAERASGFPRMARAGDGLLLAWTLPEGEGEVRVRAAYPRAGR